MSEQHVAAGNLLPDGHVPVWHQQVTTSQNFYWGIIGGWVIFHTTISLQFFAFHNRAQWQCKFIEIVLWSFCAKTDIDLKMIYWMIIICQTVMSTDDMFNDLVMLLILLLYYLCYSNICMSMRIYQNILYHSLYNRCDIDLQRESVGLLWRGGRRFLCHHPSSVVRTVQVYHPQRLQGKKTTHPQYKCITPRDFKVNKLNTPKWTHRDYKKMICPFPIHFNFSMTSSKVNNPPILAQVTPTVLTDLRHPPPLLQSPIHIFFTK